ncbi:MAG TPA: hypothetical protein VH595_15960 [Verrucomicrobiae bacterium]|nr:hypothetical protein [Verrucomicrobiae bacterium]
MTAQKPLARGPWSLGAANQVLKLTTDRRALKNRRQALNQLAGNSAVDSHGQKPRRENQAVSGPAVAATPQKNQRASPFDGISGSLTGRLASRYSATGQTNRRFNPNLSGGALNGQSEITLHFAVVRSGHYRPAPFRF